MLNVMLLMIYNIEKHNYILPFNSIDAIELLIIFPICITIILRFGGIKDFCLSVCQWK